jgi:hypothetical protein
VPDHIANNVVTDAQGLRESQAAEAYDDATERRPPHPMNGQFPECIFSRINRYRKQRRQHAGHESHQHTSQKSFGANEKGMSSNREQRTQPDDIAPDRGSGGTRQCNGNKTSWLPLKEQKFDCQQRSRYGRCKGGRHAARCTRDEQGLALGTRKVHKLREHWTKGAAGHDDRTLGAKRPARTNGDGRGKRLQKGQPGFNPAALDKNGLDRLRNAVASNTLWAIARHETYNKRAQNRHKNFKHTEPVPGRRDQPCSPALKEKEIREKANEPEQTQRHKGAERADSHRD